MKKTISGKLYMEAVRWAFQACPKADPEEELAHVVFIDHRVLCSDGLRLFAGIYPLEGEQDEVLVATRESVEDLLLALKYASRMSSRHNREFTVQQDGATVAIKYGESKRDVLHHELVRAEVGYVPEHFDEWVAPDAPAVNATETFLHAGHVNAATKWSDDTAFSWRGAGGREPVRLDVRGPSGDVGVAYLLPKGREPAQLPADEPLLRGKGDRPTGKSLLDLRLDLQAKEKRTIKFGDMEIDVTGIENPNRLVTNCIASHRDSNEPCYQCTEAAVAGERVKVQEQAKTATGKRGRKLRAVKDDEQAGDDEGDADGNGHDLASTPPAGEA